jgi:hypothetical protein
MKKIILGVLITLIVLFGYRYFQHKNDDKAILYENSMLIQEQIKNVGKLVVTEGHFSEVFNYKNSKELFSDFFIAEKRALVVVNADITIAYDLSKIEYNVDEATKTLQIVSIPKEEISIYPDIEYYDIQADYFNPFEANDYNKIKETVKKSLLKKLENSSLKTNAKFRLLDELSKFYILTNSLGWTLLYEETPITDKKVLFELEL